MIGMGFGDGIWRRWDRGCDLEIDVRGARGKGDVG